MKHNKVSLLKATLESLINQSKEPIEVCDELSEEKIWSTHAPLIWKADSFVDGGLTLRRYLILLRGRLFFGKENWEDT